MKEHNIKIRELILTSDKKTFSCETFVYEPSNIEEESLGNLYIIGWVKSQKKDLEFLPNLIASIAKREFYKLSDKDPETSFENCLKKANAALLDISREHKNLRRHISFCILNTSKNKMRFSQIGEHFIYLLKNEVVLDIGSSKESKNRFSAVISGDINVGDKYIFGTSKLGDLFSKKSIGRVLDDKIEKQAETINRIYEAESREIPFPPQAALLLEVISPKRSKILKNVFGTSKNINIEDKISKYSKEEQEEPVSKYKEKINNYFPAVLEFLKRKKVFIGSSFIIIILVASISFYIKMSNAYKLADVINIKIAEAEATAQKNKEKALDIFKEAKNTTLILKSYPFFSKKSDDIIKTIEKKENETKGLFNIISLERFGKIPGKSLGFSPKFIFESKDNIYVFSDTLNMFYKIKSDDKSGSFLFLDQSPFEIEKAFLSDGLFYFINYIKKQVYYFDPKDEKIYTIESEKQLRKLLKLKPTPYNKDFKDINFSMDRNQIIKKEGETEKYFNFLSLIRIRDFTISEDNKFIYLLSEREVFKTENK